MLASMRTKQEEKDLWVWFGQKLRAHRKERNLSGNWLAEQTRERTPEDEISQSTFSQLELGKRRPSDSNIRALAAIDELGVTAEQLECWRDVSPIKPEGVRRIKKWLPELLEDDEAAQREASVKAALKRYDALVPESAKGIAQQPEAEPPEGADLRPAPKKVSKKAWCIPADLKEPVTKVEVELMRKLDPSTLGDLGPQQDDRFWHYPRQERIQRLRHWVSEEDEFFSDDAEEGTG